MTPEQIETLKEHAKLLDRWRDELIESSNEASRRGEHVRSNRLRSNAECWESTAATLRAALALAEERQAMETGKNQSTSKWSLDGRDIVDEEGIYIGVATCSHDAKHIVDARNDAVNSAWKDGYSAALAAANKAIGGGK